MKHPFRAIGRIFQIIITIAFLLGFLINNVFAQDVGPIKVLMITGGGPFHDYPTQLRQLRNGLTERIGNIDWTIDHEEGKSEKDMHFKFQSQLTDDWAKKYDLVLYNSCNLDMGDADHVKQIMSDHAKYKVPAVLLHCVMHLNRTTTPKWYNFTGAVSYQHTTNRKPFTVEVTKPDNPIMVNFPHTWRTPKGELYFPFELKKNTKVLARAYSIQAQEFFPIAWTHTYKGVRVFASTLGHYDAMMGSDVNLNVVSAGLLWAAGKLKDDGRPAKGYKGRRGLGWISLWDGKTFNGWRASVTTDWAHMNWFGGAAVWPTKQVGSTRSFRVDENHNIIADGPQSNLYYEGRINGGDFKDFELKSEVYAEPETDSGIFFHTRYQDKGNP